MCLCLLSALRHNWRKLEFAARPQLLRLTAGSNEAASSRTQLDWLGGGGGVKASKSVAVAASGCWLGQIVRRHFVGGSRSQTDTLRTVLNAARAPGKWEQIKEIAAAAPASLLSARAGRVRTNSCAIHTLSRSVPRPAHASTRISQSSAHLGTSRLLRLCSHSKSIARRPSET